MVREGAAITHEMSTGTIGQKPEVVPARSQCGA
jgi:hypothetical protein